jgi:hypothetical protein
MSTYIRESSTGTHSTLTHTTATWVQIPTSLKNYKRAILSKEVKTNNLVPTKKKCRPYNDVYWKEGRSDPGCRNSLRARRASTPTGSPTPRSGCSSVQNVDRVSRARGIYRYNTYAFLRSLSLGTRPCLVLLMYSFSFLVVNVLFCFPKYNFLFKLRNIT